MRSNELIHTDGRVLAALDTSVYASSVADHAAWAASRLQAPLELLHVIDRRHGLAGATDLSGNLSLDDREALLQQLAGIDEQHGRLAQEQGRRLLDQARARAAEKFSVDASVKQRHGSLVESLLDLEPGVRLFVIGKRGENADFARGRLGGNLERVMRAVHRPVLIASRAFKPIESFMIAFDGSATTRKCVEVVCASPLLGGLRSHVLMVGNQTTDNLAHMQWATSTLTAAGFAPQAHFAIGTPDKVISSQVQSLGVEFLVMGAYGHSRIRNLIVGSTTTQVLRECPIPMLLLR